MARLDRALHLLALFLSATTTSAQVLTSGNGQLPACAQKCSNLVRAAQACGGNAGTSTAIWACFCQSAYITPFENNAAGVCPDTCSSASDNQNVISWYKSNCGNDYGASEHANQGSGGTTTVVSTSTSTSAAAGGQKTSSAATAGAASATGSSGADVQGQGAASTQQDSGWWSSHYKWVIMLIVLFIALLALALLALWLKKRHQRKADQISSSFNEGITTRSAPSGPLPGTDGAADSPMKQVDRTAVSGPYAQHPAAAAAGSTSVLESGRNTPTRTREAFMPYGYGYARSESRNGSRGNLPEDAIVRAGSPLAQQQMSAGMGAEEGGKDGVKGDGKKRRVLVRERSVEQSSGG